MQTKPRASSIITHELRGDVLVFKVAGAGPATVEGGAATTAELVFDPAACSEVNRTRFMRHGVFQRINDAAALSRNTKDGKPASPVAKFEAMSKVAAHYLSGTAEWALERVAVAPGLDGTVIAAVCEATGKAEDVVRAMVAAGATKHTVTPQAYLTGLAGSARVAPILARMRAAASGVNADDELDAMMTEPDAEPGVAA